MNTFPTSMPVAKVNCAKITEVPKEVLVAISISEIGNL